MRLISTLMVASLAMLALSACDRRPAQFVSPGAPERLLDASSEVVNLPVSNALQINELSSFVNADQPTRAELYCTNGDAACEDAKDVLQLYGVQFQTIPSPQATVTLVYERVLARDCNATFVNNTRNNLNRHHPAFGCATAANIVQHVSDKQQFVNPPLMRDGRATKAVQAYRRSADAPTNQQAVTISNSAIANQ